MANTHSIPWKRLTAEGVAIVASILLAFWIDEWWQSRQESIVESKYLAALIIEIDELVLEVDRTIARNNELNVTAAASIDNLRMGNAPEGAELRAMLEDGWVAHRLRANLDTYTDLLSSGAVTTLSDSEVRIVLAQLSEIMDFEQETFEAVTNFGQRLRPLLLQSLASEDLETVAHIAEDIVNVRSLHTERKRDVKEIAGRARAIISTALE